MGCLYINKIIEDWKKQDIKKGLISLSQSTKVSTFLSADGQIILSESEEQLQQAAGSLYKVSLTNGMTDSITKTKFMAVKNKEICLIIVIDNHMIEQVKTFNIWKHSLL
jgi:hypothetical protein